MTELAYFSPDLAFFDRVYGAVMVDIPVSLDSPFLALSGDAGAKFTGNCTCTVGDGGWIQTPPDAGEQWIQRPLAEDNAPDTFIN